MRYPFYTEELPPCDEILARVKAESPNAFALWEKFLTLYYNTLYTVSNIYGFSLLRIELDGVLFILQRQDIGRIILELREYGKSTVNN